MWESLNHVFEFGNKLFEYPFVYVFQLQLLEDVHIYFLIVEHVVQSYSDFILVNLPVTLNGI